jgi:pseudouridine-5'-phosphate glycosidase
LVIASSLAILGFGGWMCRDKFPQVQFQSLSFNQEGNVVTNLQSAQKLGMEAAIMVQNPPHQEEVWQQAQYKWQQAINLLESIPEGTSVSDQANKQLANYRVNHAAISQRLLTESKAAANLEFAQKLAMEAAVMVQNPPHQEEVWQQAFFKWQQAINILEGIPEGTFAYQTAKEKLSIYKINYAAIATRLKY